MFRFIVFFSLLFLYSICEAQNRSEINVIPAPAFVEHKTGSFLFTPQLIIVANSTSKPVAVFLRKFLLSHQIKHIKIISSIHAIPKGVNVIHLNPTSNKSNSEAYILEISNRKIEISGNNAGLFYGVQTLMQLFLNNKKNTVNIPCMLINDKPLYAYRGFMLDVSRHFFTVAQIKDLLDLMAYYKLNRFHWHFTDDQGWRVEIKKYPKLTSIGACRVPRIGDFGLAMAPPKPGEKATDCGFYTQDEIKDVVNYALARNIQIMPEIDVPGHSLALVASYPELSVTKDTSLKVSPGSSFAKWFPTGGYEMYLDNTLNPTDDKVYQFLDNVFTEIASLFPYEYIHIGGDECFKGFWEKDPQVQTFMLAKNIKNTHDLQSYFTARVKIILKSKNKKMIGWDEIYNKNLGDSYAIMNRFGGKSVKEQVDNNIPLILAPGNNGLYFDYAQSYSVMEPANHGGYSPAWKAYEYNPLEDLSQKQKSLIMGIEGCLWTESVHTVSKMQYSLLPRMLSLSESAWSSKSAKNYSRFSNSTLPVHLAQLDKQGYNYRVPTPFGYTDSVLIGNKFTITPTVTVLGGKIFYTLNNRHPGDADHQYNKPLNFELKSGEKKIMKSIMISPAGRRSVISQTIMYNPKIKKATPMASVEKGINYTLEPGTFSGKLKDLKIPSDFKIGSKIILQGFIDISADDYYTYTAEKQNILILVDDIEVFDSKKPYPKFEKSLPLYLQKGLHKVQITFSPKQLENPAIIQQSNNGEKNPLLDNFYIQK